MYVCIGLCKYVCIYIKGHMYTYRVYTHAYMHKDAHVFIYIHIKGPHMYTHTHLFIIMEGNMAVNRCYSGAKSFTSVSTDIRQRGGDLGLL